MKTYIVGGYVRDTLLNLPTADRDWVVVGATPQEMVNQGYRPVGRGFPVFLHPESHEEYALARTERKSAPGYRGFVVNTSVDVTLEQDLARRDLTINAIAQTQDGELIDPYHGQQDIKDKILRHVSSAFTEDPVRVLRIARFAARFNFTIADETKQLVKQMLAANELDHLVPERVWQELEKALNTPQPSLFFMALRDMSALAVLLPEIDRLFGVPQMAKWHPEIDTGVHTMLVLDQAAKLSDDITVRFAALCHDLGKGTTPSNILPSHIGHEKRGVFLTQALCQRLRVPTSMARMAVIVAQYHTHIHRIFEMKPATILGVFEALNAFRKPICFEQYLLAGEADYRGRPGYEQAPIPQLALFRHCFLAAQSVDVQAIIRDGLQGVAIAKELRIRRMSAISAVRAEANYKQ